MASWGEWNCGLTFILMLSGLVGTPILTVWVMENALRIMVAGDELQALWHDNYSCVSTANYTRLPATPGPNLFTNGSARHSSRRQRGELARLDAQTGELLDRFTAAYAAFLATRPPEPTPTRWGNVSGVNITFSYALHPAESSCVSVVYYSSYLSPFGLLVLILLSIIMLLLGANCVAVGRNFMAEQRLERFFKNACRGQFDAYGMHDAVLRFDSDGLTIHSPDLKHVLVKNARRSYRAAWRPWEMGMPFKSTFEWVDISLSDAIRAPLPNTWMKLAVDVELLVTNHRVGVRLKRRRVYEFMVN